MGLLKSWGDHTSYFMRVAILHLSAVFPDIAKQRKCLKSRIKKPGIGSLPFPDPL